MDHPYQLQRKQKYPEDGKYSQLHTKFYSSPSLFSGVKCIKVAAGWLKEEEIDGSHGQSLLVGHLSCQIILNNCSCEIDIVRSF